MKKLFSAILLLCIATTFSAMAKTVTINLSNYVGKDVTKYLRTQLQKLSYTDKAIITLGKSGNYYLSGTITGNCSVSLTGKGVNSTKIILRNGSDSNGFKAFTDDTFLEFTGTKEHPITVTMNNLSINLAEHDGYWWVNELGVQMNKTQEKYAVKIYHANQVDIQKVNSTLKNAMITNINLRVCSNVTIKNCKLVNYNNCYTGGNLWIDGKTDNVVISNNQFYKYGNDEALGIYGRANNAYDYTGSETKDVTKSNISVTNNEFYYGYNGSDKIEIANDVLVDLVTDQNKTQYSCSISNFEFSGNTFSINGPVKISLMLDFDPKDVHTGMRVSGNTFLNQDNGAAPFYKCDIRINDCSNWASMDPIDISNNSFITSSYLLNPSNDNGLSHLQINGGNVNFTSNNINDKVAANKKCGGQLLWLSNSASISMTKNTATGLSKLATISSGTGVEKTVITANNNSFEGATTIYCDNANTIDLNFTGNTFNSSNMNFFLQEFGKQGSLVFTGNTINVAGGGGQLMTHWSNKNTQEFHFNRLEVTDNVFTGINSEADMMRNITNASSRNTRRNSYLK